MKKLETERVALYCGDCLCEMEAIQDGVADMVLTDPPYSSGGLFAGDRKASTQKKYTDSDAQGAARFQNFSGDNMDQRSFNGIKNKNLIRVGQVIYLTPVAAACGKLAKLGVINSPDYWTKTAEAGTVQYLDTLLIKAAKTITKAGTRTKTWEEGLAVLVTAGVVNTPDYWKSNIKTVASLDALMCALGGAVK